jgi:acetyl-CoA acyltransferase
MGDDPTLMLNAPVPSTRKILQRAGMTLDDIDLFEVNEAFAVVPLAWLAEIAAGDDAVGQALNPGGGAIAIGHPLGASGARLMTAMVHHQRAFGIRYGLQTMCEGGGQANVTIIERLG